MIFRCLEKIDGFVPMRRDPASKDPRYLGTFIDFTGGGF
jgi:hypothetical protein